MKRIRALAIATAMSACTPAPSSPPTATTTPTTTTPPPSTPTSTSPSTPASTPTSTSPPFERCSVGQINTPCVMKKSDGCFVRRSNCAGLPCTEAAPERVECSVFELAAPANACGLHTKCLGQYKEGCVVGPRTQKLALAISPACASALLQAASCKDFEATFAKPLCR